jgi:hypothetical protein
LNSLFIATPMYGGMCHGSYTLSLLQVIPTFVNAQMGVQFGFLTNESLVTRARNALVGQFLQTDATHLMFIDSDIGFRAQDILAMINADKDIICGLYPHKTIIWERVAEAVKDGVPPQELHKHASPIVDDIARDATGTEPIEVPCGGTGFMLIKREVLEGLTDKVPDYNDFLTSQTIKQYFDTSIDPARHNILLSEDYHFCKLARSNGYTVWAAPWAELTHSGTYQFTSRAGKSV